MTKRLEQAETCCDCTECIWCTWQEKRITLPGYKLLFVVTLEDKYRRRLKTYNEWTSAHKIQCEWRFFQARRSKRARSIQSAYRRYKSTHFVTHVRLGRLEELKKDALIINYADDRHVRDKFKGDQPGNRK